MVADVKRISIHATRWLSTDHEVLALIRRSATATCPPLAVGGAATASFGKGSSVAVKWAHKYDLDGMTSVVFRPKANVRTGKCFWVRVEGVSGEDGEGDLEYIVEFFNR